MSRAPGWTCLLLFCLLIMIPAVSPAQVLWSPDNGVAIHSSQGARITSGSLARNEAGTLLVWTDALDGERPLLGQLLDADGEPLWDEPAMVANSPGYWLDQYLVVPVSDDTWVVLWLECDDLEPYTDDYQHLYMQCIDADGNALWTGSHGLERGVRVPVQGWSQSAFFDAVPDGQGGVYITYINLDQSNIMVRLERFTSAGERAPGWPTLGVELINYGHLSEESQVELLRRTGGGVWVATIEESHSPVYVFGVDAAGNVLPDELELGDNDRKSDMAIRTDGAGGMYVVWCGQYESTVEAIRLDSDGSPMWPEPVVLDSILTDYDAPNLLATRLPDNTLGVVWYDQSDEQPKWRAERIGGDTNCVWMYGIDEPGVTLVTTNSYHEGGSGLGIVPRLDGGLGVILRFDDTEPMIQGVDSHGNLLWVTPHYIDPEVMYWKYLSSIPIADGVARTAWISLDEGSYDVKLQDIDYFATDPIADPPEVLVHSVTGRAASTAILPGDGFIWCAWQEEWRLGYPNSRLSIQHLDPETGECLFPEPLNALPGLPFPGTGSRAMDPMHTFLDPDGNLLLLLNSEQTLRDSVHMQKITPDGTLLWGDRGRTVGTCSYATEYLADAHLQGCPDDNGGLVVLWSEYNSLYIGDLVIQHFDASGEPLWPGGNLPGVLLLSGESVIPKSLYPLGDGWFAVAYQELEQIAWRILADGTVDWQQTFDLGTDSHYYIDSIPFDDGLIALFIGREPDGLYAIRFAADGNTVWDEPRLLWSGDMTTSSARAATCLMDTDPPSFWFSWRDNSSYEYVAQRFTLDGEPATDVVPLIAGEIVHLVPAAQDGVWALISDWYGVNDDGDIYYTLIRSNGTLSPEFDPPLTLCDAFSLQTLQSSLPDGEGGVISVWGDNRATAGYYAGYAEFENLYGQRIAAYYDGVGTGPSAAPDAITFSLEPVYPNPFNATTRLRFTINLSGSVSLVIYDITGREVARLVDATMPAGAHRAMFDGTGLASGVYFARLTGADQTTRTQRLVLVK